MAYGKREDKPKEKEPAREEIMELAKRPAVELTQEQRELVNKWLPKFLNQELVAQ